MRIASLNLCTDSMLFELAEPAQIVSVTALSRDEGISYFAGVARDVRVNHGLAEEIVPLEPDLILAARHVASGTNALLSRLGYRVMTFEPTMSIADFRSSFLRLADAIGAQEKASRLLADMDRALRRAAPDSRSARPRAIIYQPNGFSPGSRSLANDMLMAAGMANLADEFGIEYGGFVPLEKLVMSAPDLLLLGGRAARFPALAELILRHPALAEHGGGPRSLRVDIAEKYWTCGGTYIAEAVARLAALSRKLREGRG
jgi:iron complex transport system substrate-binding protein